MTRTPSNILDSIRPGMADRLREAGACAAKPNRADVPSGVGTPATRSVGLARNRVLSLLKDGRPRTVADVAIALNLDRDEARASLMVLASGRHVRVTHVERVAVFEVRK